MARCDWLPGENLLPVQCSRIHGEFYFKDKVTHGVNQSIFIAFKKKILLHASGLCKTFISKLVVLSNRRCHWKFSPPLTPVVKIQLKFLLNN